MSKKMPLSVLLSVLLGLGGQTLSAEETGPILLPPRSPSVSETESATSEGWEIVPVADTHPTPARLGQKKIVIAVPRQLPERYEATSLQEKNSGEVPNRPLQKKQEQHFKPKVIESGDREAVTIDEGWQPVDEIPQGAVLYSREHGVLPESETPPGETIQEGMFYDEQGNLIASPDCYGLPMEAAGYGIGHGLFDQLTITLGASGFKNCLDFGNNGNFGFSESFNYAYQLTPHATFYGQFGFRSTQTNFTGTGFDNTQEVDSVADYNRNHRTQYFYTTGIFRRSLCSPLQGGVVYDWYHDHYRSKMRLEQFRAELSYRTCTGWEFGFLGGFGCKTQFENMINTPFSELIAAEDQIGDRYKIKANNYYTLFLRKHLLSGGLAMFHLGATDSGDTILGSKFELPISDRLTGSANFMMMIPGEGHTFVGQKKEAWSLGLELTWHFGGGAFYRSQNVGRPMFDVADNSSIFPSISWK